MDKVKFWKKHDDFSFDQDSTPSADPEQSSANVQNYLDGANASDSYANPLDQGLPPDPMNPGGFGRPQDPLAMNTQPTQGQQMAQDYIQSQQAVQQPPQQQQTQANNVDQKIEMVNLKLDAIKSELDALNQHIKKLEVMLERSGAKRW